MKKNIISSVLLLVVYRINYLSSSGQLGNNPITLRNTFPFEYMPAGRTFGLAWGLIYLALGNWLIRSRTSSGRKSEVNQKIIPWFWTSCLLNILWVVASGNERYMLSVGIIILLMFTLWYIIDLLPRNDSRVMTGPFGLYAGWVTMAAVIIGISQFLYKAGFDIVIQPGRTWIALGSGMLVAGRMFYKRRNRAQFLITLIALIGIASSIFGF